MQRSCRNCVHWKGKRESALREYGECRRYPPVIQVSGLTEFPKTSGYSGCGEFRLTEELRKQLRAEIADAINAGN